MSEENIVTAPPPPSGKPGLWTRDFTMIIIVNAFLFTGFQMLPTALPPYLKFLGAPDQALGLLSGISMVAALIMRPLSGLLLDSIGRRVVFLTGLLILVFSTTAFYFFPVVWIILAVRFVHGVGWGIASTACSTVAADYIPKVRFGEGMGYFGLAASFGMAVAPALALSMPAGPMIWTSTGFSMAALLIALLLRYKRVENKPKIPGIRVSIYERAAVLPSVVMLFSTVAFGAVVTFVALYARERGIEQNVGLFFTVYASVMLISRPSIGKLIDRKGSGVVIIPSLLFSSLAMLLLWKAETFHLLLLSGGVYGLGQGMMFSGAQAMAVLNSPRHRIGAANATFFTGFDLGLGCGAMFSGYLASMLGYADMFLIFTVFPVIGIIVYLLGRKNVLTGPYKDDGQE